MQKWKTNTARKALCLVKAYESWSGQIVRAWLYGDIHSGLKLKSEKLKNWKVEKLGIIWKILTWVEI